MGPQQDAVPVTAHAVVAACHRGAADSHSQDMVLTTAGEKTSLSDHAARATASEPPPCLRYHRHTLGAKMHSSPRLQLNFPVFVRWCAVTLPGYSGKREKKERTREAGATAATTHAMPFPASSLSSKGSNGTYLVHTKEVSRFRGGHVVNGISTCCGTFFLFENPSKSNDRPFLRRDGDPEERDRHQQWRSCKRLPLGKVTWTKCCPS